MSNRTHKRTRPHNGRRSNLNRNKWNPKESTSSTRSRVRIAPDERDVTLMFRYIGNLADVGANLAIKEFTPNAAYDVDPALGSTETYGFDEEAAVYSYYRVISYRYEITYVNNGADPAMVYVVHSNTQPSAAGTRWDLYSTNTYNKSKLLASYGGAPTTHTFRGRMDCSRLLGSKALESADSLRSLTTGVPSDLLWLGCAVESTGAGVGVGATLDMKLWMDIRFYGRELDLTLAGALARRQARLTAREEYRLKKKLDAVKTGGSKQ